MFKDAKQFITDAIAANVTLQTITLLDAITADYDNVLKSALRDEGLAIVVVPVQGNRGPSLAAVEIEHDLLVVILENTLKNQTGNDALDIAETLIGAVDASALSMNSRKLKFRSGSPAYELGTTEANPVTVFCNFKYRTIKTQ